MFFFITSYHVHKITGSRDVEHRTRTENAIIVITSRSKYYWIVQAISRSGAAIYEQVYGYGGYKGSSNANEFASAIIFGFLTPSASIGYLAIFLAMQPGAKKSLLELLWVNIPTFITCGIFKGWKSDDQLEEQLQPPESPGTQYITKDGSFDKNSRKKNTEKHSIETTTTNFNSASVDQMSTSIGFDRKSSQSLRSTEDYHIDEDRNTNTSGNTNTSDLFKLSNDLDDLKDGTDVGISSVKIPEKLSSGETNPSIAYGCEIRKNHATVDSVSHPEQRNSFTTVSSINISNVDNTIVSSGSNRTIENSSGASSWTSMLSRNLASDFMANLTGPASANERSGQTHRDGLRRDGSIGGMRRNFGSTNFADLCVDDLDDDILFKIIEQPANNEQRSTNVYNNIISSSWDNAGSPPDIDGV